MPTGWTVDEGRDDEEPVEFVIGMRWQHLWRLAWRPWVPLAFAQMLPPQAQAGLCSTRLGVRPAGPVVVQRWASRRAVEAWARARGRPHLGPWRRFRHEVGGTADWGVWHEVGPVRGGASPR